MQSDVTYMNQMLTDKRCFRCSFRYIHSKISLTSLL